MRSLGAPLAALLLALAAALPARPSNIDGTGQSCAACHSVQPAATVSFLSVNGAAVGTSVAASPGQVLGVVYRVQGLSGGSPIGAFVRPTGAKADFAVAANGPVWSDNGRSGATAWATGSSVAWRAALGGAEGQGQDNGGTSDPNRLANNEVFSVSLTVQTLVSGVASVELGAGANNLGQRYAAKVLDVHVTAATATPTPSPSQTPLLGTPTATPSETPFLSATPSPTASPTPTESPVLSPTPTATLTATPAVLPDNSFTGVQGAGLLASPIRDGVLGVWMELSAAADQGELRVYTANFARVATLSTGPLPKGRSQSRVSLPPLAPQALWVQVLVQKSGRWRPGPILLTYLLP